MDSLPANELRLSSMRAPTTTSASSPKSSLASTAAISSWGIYLVDDRVTEAAPIAEYMKTWLRERHAR